MIRKVIKYGPSTYGLSLPKQWVKQQRIQKGDELDVQVQEKQLIVNLQRSAEEREANLDVTGLDRTLIMFSIRSLYRIGYDTVNVSFRSPIISYGRYHEEVSVLSVIHLEVNRLVGYEIVREEVDRCSIKDIQESTSRDFSSVLRRVFLLLLDTYNCLLEGVRNADRHLLDTIEDKHDAITKFVSYCMRMISKENVLSVHQGYYYYHIIGYIDRLTDVIKYNARKWKRMQRFPHPWTMEGMERIKLAIETFYKLFYSYSNSDLMIVNEQRYAVEASLVDVPDGIASDELVTLTELSQMLELLMDMVEARMGLENTRARGKRGGAGAPAETA